MDNAEPGCSNDLNQHETTVQMLQRWSEEEAEAEREKEGECDKTVLLTDEDAESDDERNSKIKTRRNVMKRNKLDDSEMEE